MAITEKKEETIMIIYHIYDPTICDFFRLTIIGRLEAKARNA